jgi:Protein of unknown function (DUF3048) C-terminal domain/Protein of unknown function (DUF3048) N-terminal domain
VVVAASSCGVVIVLNGCSAVGHSSPTASARPAAVSSPASVEAGSKATANPTASAGSVAPLTGLNVTAAVALRPAVAVAVAGSDPVGLSSADLVFQEMTVPVRYLAVFQSDEASKVGMVTSTLPSDGQALSVLHPLTSYDGGTSSFISVLDATKIIDDGYARHASLYSAGSGGLTVSTALAAAGSSDTAPPALFFYRLPSEPLATGHETHPTSVQVEVPGQSAERWDFDARADRWVETAGGPRVSVANLIVQIVSFKTVYLSRKYGQTTQSARVVGTGQTVVFSGTAPGGDGGTAAAGTWTKPGLAAVTNYFDAAHLPMDFAPGPTWILLAPAGTRTSQAGG